MAADLAEYILTKKETKENPEDSVLKEWLAKQNK
jgi:hypothetical protein